jgi:hypothetical protein
MEANFELVPVENGAVQQVIVENPPHSVRNIYLDAVLISVCDCLCQLLVPFFFFRGLTQKTEQYYRSPRCDNR